MSGGRMDESFDIHRARLIGEVIGKFLPPMWNLRREQQAELMAMINQVVDAIMHMQIKVEGWRRERPDADV